MDMKNGRSYKELYKPNSKFTNEFSGTNNELREFSIKDTIHKERIWTEWLHKVVPFDIREL